MNSTQLDDYIKAEGLDQIIDFSSHSDWKERAHDNVSGTLGFPFPPEKEDLVRLHTSIRERKSFTVLEFGLGYSSIVIADALSKNKKEFDALKERPDIRNNFMFQLFSVDASEEWIESLKKNIPKHLEQHITISHSNVHIGTFQDQICHYYDNIPNIIADFIYLDGPSPKDVQGSLNGLNFQIDERTVMSGDILRMEPTLLPGTLIHVDGRTNNCRFMENNFKRKYKKNWVPEGDFTTYELDEKRLGKYNILGSDFM